MTSSAESTLTRCRREIAAPFYSNSATSASPLFAQMLDACHGLADADIAHAIRQATGPRSPLFVPEAAFEVLARRQIALFRPLTLQASLQIACGHLRMRWSRRL